MSKKSLSTLKLSAAAVILAAGLGVSGTTSEAVFDAPYYDITKVGGSFNGSQYVLNGTTVTDSFFCDGTYTYFLQTDGTPMKDRLTYHPDGKQVIYFDANGHECFDTFAHVKKSIAGDAVDDLCYFGTYGNLYVNVITYNKEGTAIYYANKYGVMERSGVFEVSSDAVNYSALANGCKYGYANSDGTVKGFYATYEEAAVQTDAGQNNGSNNTVQQPNGEGKVLNIYCWNEEFKYRLADHYPGYEEVDGTTGKIGDVTVKWNIISSDDNAYQNNLDAALTRQVNAAADDKVDLFLVEADYALKYVDTDYTMSVKNLGITDANLANQYQYTKDVVTDSNGNLKGVAWQCCPGALIYNREAAKKVLGTDDPAVVQKSVFSWDIFTETAERMKAAGYNMVSSADDTYRVYSDNTIGKWVQNEQIVIDDHLMRWADNSKKMYDAKESDIYDLWSDDWSKGFYPDGKVFCYFGPAWFINYSMGADNDGSIANQGGWGVTNGPQGFFWGGTWICSAAGTDNPSLVKDIMLKMTADETIMKEMAIDDDDFVNNKSVMNAMAADTSYQSEVLGGQNPLAVFCANAEKIRREAPSVYDQGCNEAFRSAMKNYIKGKVSLDDALDLFYADVQKMYPELKR